MSKADLPAAIEAAELHVQAADGQVEYAARQLRQGWTRKKRPVTNVAKVALPLIGLAWLLRKKKPSPPPKRDGVYYMGAMPPAKTNFVMGMLATAVATRALWIPVLSAAVAEMQRRRAIDQALARELSERAGASQAAGAEESRPGHAAAYRRSDVPGAPGASRAPAGSDPRVDAGYH